MSDQKPEYQVLVERVKDALEHTPDELERWVALTERYVSAAREMTQDELALIQSYFKRDVQEFGSQYEESSEQPDVFTELVKDSLWEQLAEITDKTQLEWTEIFDDIKHHGIYEAGEVVGLGILECEKCGNQTRHNHVGVLPTCVNCGNRFFSRHTYPA
ncbi:hypothetical protein CS022_11250 [Veronia nyctiphanis]|uniref:Zinc ribbon-containing protein n=1 Tax=Veronia nyctiphanis TaxID=1278244 RepID=A0A4Q0YR53_9GAMM|nr:hypothetical protein [Veronia nyctiphanis]RXJ73085.1 hypothetical protein CS022_11250 [Veronia nyctiphanis]